MNYQIIFKDNDGDNFGGVAQIEVDAANEEHEQKFYQSSVYHTNVQIICIDCNFIASYVPPPGWVGNNSDYDDTNTCITYISPQNFYLDADGDGVMCQILCY